MLELFGDWFGVDDGVVLFVVVCCGVLGVGGCWSVLVLCGVIGSLVECVVWMWCVSLGLCVCLCFVVVWFVGCFVCWMMRVEFVMSCVEFVCGWIELRMCWMLCLLGLWLVDWWFGGWCWFFFLMCGCCVFVVCCVDVIDDDWCFEVVLLVGVWLCGSGWFELRWWWVVV